MKKGKHQFVAEAALVIYANGRPASGDEHVTCDVAVQLAEKLWASLKRAGHVQ